MLMKKSSFAAAVALALVLAGCSGNGPDENIALNKAAYASSTYDYNLTAQLVTDGVVESRLRAGYGVFHARRVTAGRLRAGFGVFHARRVTDGRLRAGYQIGGWVTSIILQCVGHIIQGRRASKKK